MLAPEPDLLEEGDSGWRTEVTPDGEVLVFKKGRLKMPNGDVYSGEFLNNMRHGRGELKKTNGDSYLGMFRNDLYHGKGTLSLGEHRVAGRLVIGWKYSGTFENGLKHGKGLLIDGEGGVYEGEFQDDRYHGHGHFRCKAFTYEGQFQRGLREGRGRMQYNGGGWYEGEWHRGEPHGEGERCYRRGGTYRGAWRMGMRHGVGRRVWATGAEYEGEWMEDKMHGRGVYRSASGDTYVGDFEADRYHGDGSLQLAHGDKYVGQFRRGQFCGRGRYEYRAGGWYEGEYWALLRTGIKWRREGKDEMDEEEGGATGGMRWAHGKGKVTGLKQRHVEARQRKQKLEQAYDVKNPMEKAMRQRLVAMNKRFGRMLVGSQWDDTSRGGMLVPAADGKRHGRGIRVWSNGARYEGDWFQDEMTGFGIYIGAGPEGVRYEGQFEEGKRQGRGVCSGGHSGGSRFVCPLKRSHVGSVGRCIFDGMWARGFMHGEGKFICCDGRSFTGTFDTGERHGFGVEVIMTQRQKQVEMKRRGPTAMSHVAERYEGWYDHNVKQGHGVLRMAVGDSLEGEFANGKLEGHVKHTFPNGKVSHAFYKMGKRVRWMKGEELDKVLAAQAAVDLFAVGGVTTDMLLQRLREANEHKQQREADKQDFSITELHVGMDGRFDQAKGRGRARRAEAAAAAAAEEEEDRQRKMAGLPPLDRSSADSGQRRAPARFVGSSASSVASADTDRLVQFGRGPGALPGHRGE